MILNYDAIRLYHGIDGMLSEEATSKRLREIRECLYTRCKRSMACQKTLQRKSGMNQTELDVLRSFPEQGIDLGYCSNAMLFAPGIVNKPLSEHKALCWLLWQRKLGIVVGMVDGKRKEVLARVAA